MPMKKGTSAATVSANAKEMMRAGHPRLQSLAAALSMKRKSKKMMADGGMVENDMDDDTRTIGELQAEGNSHPDSVANPSMQSDEQMMVDMLRKKAENEMGYAMGGLVQPDTEDEPLGTKPTEDMGGPMTEAPMSDENEDAELGHDVVEGVPDLSPSPLSEEAMSALAMKKKKRRYMQ